MFTCWRRCRSQHLLAPFQVLKDPSWLDGGCQLLGRSRRRHRRCGESKPLYFSGRPSKWDFVIENRAALFTRWGDWR